MTLPLAMLGGLSGEGRTIAHLVLGLVVLTGLVILGLVYLIRKRRQEASVRRRSEEQ